ncbi:MAG: hypothetical protein E5Y69_31580 [Mesorhizobium sp.]|nr:MAG: hypothetical protein E5Y69_31580 [Mesorhizobium sp.]
MPATDGEIAAILSALEADLLDAQTARFKDVCSRMSKNDKGAPVRVWCGMINAKNAYGAYVGYKPFMRIGGDATPFIRPSDNGSLDRTDAIELVLSFETMHCVACEGREPDTCLREAVDRQKASILLK